ncbi:GGDEF domain-containing protein [Anaeromicropila herbilytica]|uniref:GGDEF domain-containing protein n=1 Tax=Anaeromicropila herbilytica TaxID=2785025 RepID=A0A7R7EP41_9FIRM|nr:GGDEF domain-containing protein [Anaeromicropila herbilytica]BCN32191.1 hypothetical protein bsdtb5_34860 [Anaeromicropila herbilytica]
MSRQKKVALFISHAFGDYQRELCNGIVNKASSYGFNVDIFSSNDGESFDDLGLGEDGILDIPKYQEYRGIIIASGTYVDQELRENILKTIEANCKCPIINVDQGETRLLSVEIDNHEPMKELVNHMIRVHKYERICFIANKNEEIYSNQRIISYKEALAENQIACEDKNIAWVLDSQTSVLQAVEYFIQNDSKLPDAIVCYNDTIALNVARVLKEKGYHIPTDIAISGYDNLEIAANNIPPMTSVEFPVYEMGMIAMDKIIHSISGVEKERTTVIPTHPIIRGSCGCVNDNCNVDSNYNLKLIHRIAKREKSSIFDMNMAGSLINITDIDEGMDVLEQFITSIENLEGLYICLYHNWNSISNKIREITNYEEEMDEHDGNDSMTTLKFGIKNKKRIPEYSFNSKMLLPEYLYSNSSSAYFYMPLYFKDRKFGYLALSYLNNLLSYDFSFMSWLRNINNMLQRICNNIELNTLVNRLEELYLKDEVTNLYNQRGFEKQIDSLMRSEELHNTSIMVATFTLKDFKKILENHGYSEAEFSIKVLASALSRSISEDAYCARTSMEECRVIAINYDEHKAALFIDTINKYLANYNALYPKDYVIQVTSNFNITYPDHLDIYLS